MIELPFGTEALIEIIAVRNQMANVFFQFVSYMGEVEGYILIITFIYMLIDKELAFRLSILALISMSLNHLLKSVIGMPRPFVSESSYMDNWLVSPENAQELVTENSTPSGHAMSSSTFYGYLLVKTNKKFVKLAVLILICLIGFSRNYLAVHYIEDILLGWVFGMFILLYVFKYSERLIGRWNGLSLLAKISTTVAASLVIWISTFFINGGQLSTQPLPFVGYLGFLVGVILGYELEKEHLNFDPKSKSWLIKVLRWFVTIALVMIPVIILDDTFESIWNQPTLWSHLLQYIGYAFSGFLGIFIAPWLFLRLKMVDPTHDKGL